jgi:hypothetical protein
MQLNNDVSQVIDRTALIENMLNQVIHGYASPQKEKFEFFWNVLLDSSIIPLGSKVKVAMAIAQQLNVKMDQKPLHRVMAFRNAFAHHALDSHPNLAVGKAPVDDQLNFMLHIIESSGKTERKGRKQALVEFNESYEAAKNALTELLDAIKSHDAP